MFINESLVLCRKPFRRDRRLFELYVEKRPGHASRVGLPRARAPCPAARARRRPSLRRRRPVRGARRCGVDAQRGESNCAIAPRRRSSAASSRCGVRRDQRTTIIRVRSFSRHLLVVTNVFVVARPQARVSPFTSVSARRKSPRARRSRPFRALSRKDAYQSALVPDAPRGAPAGRDDAAFGTETRTRRRRSARVPPRPPQRQPRASSAAVTGWRTARASSSAVRPSRPITMKKRCSTACWQSCGGPGPSPSRAGHPAPASCP